MFCFSCTKAKVAYKPFNVDGVWRKTKKAIARRA